MKRLQWMIGVGLSALLVGTTGDAQAATVIWGGGTGAWGTAANWIGGALPGASDTASFTGWVPMPRTGWTVTATTGVNPSNAADGTWGTRWTTETGAASGQALKIDLGSTQTFARIVLDATGDATDYPPAFDVYVSNDGSAWGSPVTSGVGSTAVTTINFPPQTARHVKVQLTAAGAHWWSVKEAFVYTTALTDDTLLARTGWTVSASANNDSAGLAIDDTPSTRWNTGTDLTAGQWFKIDLGAPASVERVDLNAFTTPTDFPPTYKVQVSTDDVSYGANVATGTGSGFISAIFTARTARYILITSTAASSYYWSIYDLNVYGTPRAATLSSSVSLAALTLAKGAITQSAGAALSVSGAFTQSAGTFTGAGALTVTGATTLSGTAAFNAGSATVTFGAFSLLGSSSFNGATGTTTFGLAPTLTSGTFTIGAAGTTGKVSLTQSTTFSSGVTLSFPASAGELSVAQGKTLTLAGPVVAATTADATQPKIRCTTCTATQGVTIAFTSTSTLNINGLEFDDSVAAGVSIASGATYTLLKNLTFKSNAANGTAGTHLVIALGTAVINVPGCFFDATAATNVALNGTAGQVRGARALFENQSVATNGAGAGEANDADGDNTPGDANPSNNYGENAAAPYYGSVVQWPTASATDTAGVAEGIPTAAFDWNTFDGYGVYAGFKNIGGAGTADRLWLRDPDGTARYFFDIPNASGDLVGTPLWSTANEVTLNLDVNGDGDKTDTSLHVVYLATTSGRLIKLIDSGSALARPLSGKWLSDFVDANVVTISSPLITDATNLYFGGTDPTTTKIFGVQVSAGALEKTLVKNVGPVNGVAAGFSWKRISGRIYLYGGSTAATGQANIYRIEVSPGAAVQAAFNVGTSSVNGSVRLSNDRALAVTNGGRLYALNASNLGTGGFTTITGFPYQTPAARPIQAPAWTDASSGLSYFGDDAGNLYSVTSAGVSTTGYPYAVTSAAIASSPIYIPGSGVVGVGAADGFLYFVDRRTAAGTPNLFNRYYIGSGSVSSVAYNVDTASYMVTSSDGKLSFVAASLVTDPTPATE